MLPPIPPPPLLGYLPDLSIHGDGDLIGSWVVARALTAAERLTVGMNKAQSDFVFDRLAERFGRKFGERTRWTPACGALACLALGHHNLIQVSYACGDPKWWLNRAALLDYVIYSCAHLRAGASSSHMRLDWARWIEETRRRYDAVCLKR
jgi:hypothetical protein